MAEQSATPITGIRARLADLLAHPDPLTAACNRIAHLVAWNQPLYPLYLWWLVGGDWWVSCWTFLSTPFFASVPVVAKRNAAAGRAMLPLAGVANGLVSLKAFGEASAVELFLVPCVLITLLAFRPGEWRIGAALLGLIALAGLAHGHVGAPLGHFTAEQYGHFRHLDMYSVAGLSLFVLWSLGRARAESGRLARA